MTAAGKILGRTWKEWGAWTGSMLGSMIAAVLIKHFWGFEDMVMIGLVIITADIAEQRTKP